MDGVLCTCSFILGPGVLKSNLSHMWCRLNLPIFLSRLQPGECLGSYDVSALFTSVPVDLALGIIKGLLEEVSTLKGRTGLPVKDIILLLVFCLHNTYFFFQGKFYEQVEGSTMGSPVSSIVAILYMEYL